MRPKQVRTDTMFVCEKNLRSDRECGTLDDVRSDTVFVWEKNSN